MNKNAITRVAAVAAAVVATAPSSSQAMIPEVSDVTMTQSATRRVTITYRLSDAPAVVTLDIQTNANTSAAADDPGWTSIGGRNICNAQGDVWKKVSGKDTYTITWQPDQVWTDAEGEGFKIAANGARARVTAWPVDNTPNYMVVDLAAANTVRYYPAADFLPGSEIGQKGAITNNTAYKTSQLVMRKIMARGVEWTMGSADGETQRKADEKAHRVALANNYYIGVFEVTQAQWKNIAPNSNSTAHFLVDGKMRPMEQLSYNEIRNTHGTSASDTSVAAGTLAADPSSDSFLGLLRSKTGLDFDLPSEAQWEFAARAGHGSGYWNDGSDILNTDEDANLNRLGRYAKNNPGGTTVFATLAPSAGGTALVGSYVPSDWGIYDMCGNVWEWCLDWYEDDITAYGGAVNIAPATPANTLSGTLGTSRVLRGASFLDAKSDTSRPGARANFPPESRYKGVGFRVVCTAGLR